MHGSPLFRAFLALALLAAMALPTYRLTHAVVSRNANAGPTPAPTLEATHLRFTFTDPPPSFRVLYLGEVLWQETAPKPEMDRDLHIPFPKEGVDLEFDLNWPDAKRAAAKAELTVGDRHIEKTIWASGPVQDVETFQ